jgi:hypothetical protein
MGRIGRLAGALLVEAGGACRTLERSERADATNACRTLERSERADATKTWWLVGNTKEPCDWRARGFEPPAEIDAIKRPYIGLRPVEGGAPDIGEPHLLVEKEGEALARDVARRLLVERNGSVSERLWRLVLGVDDVEEAPRGGVSARWLVEVPDPVWQVVRDSVLRCL